MIYMYILTNVMLMQMLLIMAIYSQAI